MGDNISLSVHKRNVEPFWKMKNKERGERTIQASSWLIPVTWAHRSKGDRPGFKRLGVKPQSASPLKHGESGRGLGVSGQ